MKTFLWQQWVEDGGWVSGIWVHLLLPQPGFLADLSWYKVLEPRCAEDPPQHVVRIFYKLKGKCPVHGACSSGETSQKSQHCDSLPSQGMGLHFHAGNPHTLAGSYLGGYVDLGRSKLHTQSAQHFHTFSTKCQLGDCQWERGTLFPKMIKSHIRVRWRQASASDDHEKHLTFWRGGVHGELDSDLVLYCSGSATERLFKKWADVCWAGTPCAAALPAKGQEWKCSLLPLNTAGQGDQKATQQRNFWTPAQHS